MTLPPSILAFVGFGVGGWVLENVVFGSLSQPRYSKAFGGARVPFLPIYALGGLAVLRAAPKVETLPWPARVAIYGVGLSALEYVGCNIDRALPGPSSWNYTASAGAEPLGSCVDVKHALMWGGLGLAVEMLVKGRTNT